MSTAQGEFPKRELRSIPERLAFSPIKKISPASSVSPRQRTAFYRQDQKHLSAHQELLEKNLTALLQRRLIVPYKSAQFQFCSNFEGANTRQIDRKGQHWVASLSQDVNTTGFEAWFNLKIYYAKQNACFKIRFTNLVL